MFGVAYKTKQGQVKYCHSSKSEHFSTDFDNIAVFAQQKTAEKVVKDLRKDGFEHTHACDLYVIKIKYEVEETIQVPQAKTKHGFAIGFHHESLNKYQYYMGVIKPDEEYYVNRFDDNVFRATVFKDKSSAELALQLLKELVRKKLNNPDRHDSAYYMNSLNNIKNGLEEAVIIPR